MSLGFVPNLGPFVTWHSADDGFECWFEQHGGMVDHAMVKFRDIPGQGRGVVARTDIPEGHTLFSIPRDLILSTRTSELPSLVGEEKWQKHKLDKGWAGLILCMMWETAKGTSSRWSRYLAMLPHEFDTLMFWNDAELEELKGSSVLDKIGKEDAERDYYENILPAIRSCPDLFLEKQSRFYSIKEYHLMGSRILSRSFSLGDSERQEAIDVNDNTLTDDAMDVDVDPDTAGPSKGSKARIEDDDDMEADDSDDDDDPSDVAMVPMADMLNARYGCNNARLFHEPKALKVVTTKPIPAGEQIYNTYGDLPNSELLRRYGYVDLLPLPRGLGEGSPADTAEIRADLVVDIVSRAAQISVESYKERIGWYLEGGGDDIFLLDLDMDLPDAFICFIRLLIFPSDEWTKARDKGKVPKPKLDETILRIAQEVLQSRLKMYATNMAEDEELLKTSGTFPINKRHAIIVRLGEKRILNETLGRVMEKLENRVDDSNKTKRKGNDLRPEQPRDKTPQDRKRKRHAS